MTSSRGFVLTTMLLLVCLALSLTPKASTQTTAQTWVAVSSTASSITGDVKLSSDYISFAHKTFKIHPVRQIPQADLANMGKIVDEGQTPSSAWLYQTMIPKTTVLLNRNDICGPQDAKWILAVYGKNDLSLAFFAGDHEPNLDYKSVQASHDLCGTYGYLAAN
jgi:hypothetical protein